MPAQTKRISLNKLGITARSYQYLYSTLLKRYSTIFSDHEYRFFQKIVWNEKRDPLNPDSGWGSRAGTLIFPLLGENAGIVPENSIGCKMDNTCYAATWNNNAYSYTDISSLFQSEPVISGDEFFYASVYCFVSKDFDGTCARISVEGKATGKKFKEYDLNKRGTWQKLNFCFRNSGGLSPVYLYMVKNGVKDFSNLKGHVIFAYPEYIIIKADPKNPDSAWGSEKYTPEYPLKGEKSFIVPQNSIGYKMDSSTVASTWDNNAYSYTNISSLFKTDSITSGNQYFYSSVYCFISNDFNGTWARISAEGGASGKIAQEYDLSKKGTWQKLQIYFIAKSGIPPVYLFWSKYGATDFKNLKGYVIYAYPEYRNDSIKKKLDISTVSKVTKSYSLSQSSFFDPEIFSLILSEIRFSVFEDTVSRVKNEKYLNDLENNNFSGSRTSRWYYTWLIFKEYPVYKKIIGGGFEYHEMFGTKFGEVKNDYPHNPFLSAFLYSGILGGIAYLWFMFLVFYYYVKYYRYHIFYFICFLIVFYFSFFSANTHFSVPIFAILSVIPFLTRYIVEKEKMEERTNRSKI